MNIFTFNIPAWEVITAIRCPRCREVMELHPFDFASFGEDGNYGHNRCPTCGLNMQAPNDVTHTKFKLTGDTRARIDMTYADIKSVPGEGWTLEDVDVAWAMLSYGLSTGYYEVHFGGDNRDEPFIWVPKEDVKKFTDEDKDLLGIAKAGT